MDLPHVNVDLLFSFLSLHFLFFSFSSTNTLAFSPSSLLYAHGVYSCISFPFILSYITCICKDEICIKHKHPPPPLLPLRLRLAEHVLESPSDKRLDIVHIAEVVLITSVVGVRQEHPQHDPVRRQIIKEQQGVMVFCIPTKVLIV